MDEAEAQKIIRKAKWKRFWPAAKQSREWVRKLTWGMYGLYYTFILAWIWAYSWDLFLPHEIYELRHGFFEGLGNGDIFPFGTYEVTFVKFWVGLTLFGIVSSFVRETFEHAEEELFDVQELIQKQNVVHAAAEVSRRYDMSYEEARALTQAVEIRGKG